MIFVRCGVSATGRRFHGSADAAGGEALAVPVSPRPAGLPTPFSAPRPLCRFTVSLNFRAISAASVLWLGPRNDGGEAYPNSEIMMDTPEVARSCVVWRPPLCMVDIRYAYPAGELFVLTEDAYF